MPPKNWDEVYKVYYHYGIFELYKDKDPHKANFLWKSGCDECSLLREIGHLCVNLSDNPNFLNDSVFNKDICPFGDGTTWQISKRTNGFYIEVFNYREQGFRFYLTKKKMKDFGQYLLDCCEYMLQHGDPI